MSSLPFIPPFNPSNVKKGGHIEHPRTPGLAQETSNYASETAQGD